MRSTKAHFKINLTGTPFESQSNRVSIYPILAINFTGTLGFSIVLPFLVYLVTDLGGNAFLYGILGATFSFFQLLGAPVLGRWSDRYGRKNILLLSQAGTVLSWCIFIGALWLPSDPVFELQSHFSGKMTVTLPLVALFVARALDGLTGGNVSVANAYLADISNDKNRSSNFGKMAASANIGFILGPAIAGLLGAISRNEVWPILTALAISVITIIMIARYLPNASPRPMHVDPEHPNIRKTLGPDYKACFNLNDNSTLSIPKILHIPSVALMLILQFLVFLAFNLFYVGFPMYAATDIHWTLARTGTFFSLMSFVMVLVQGPILKKATKLWNERSLILYGSIILSISFLFFESANTTPLYVGMILLAIGNGLMWPSLLSALANSTEKRFQGSIQGIASSVSAAASIFGLIVGGMVYRFIGSDIFTISAILILIAFISGLALPSAIRRQ